MSKLQLFDTRRDFLKTSLAAAAGLGLAGLKLKAQRVFHHRPMMDDPTTHNMMVVGTKTVYLSHLPMFDSVSDDGAEFTSPHRRQVILEATFTQAGRDLTPLYFKDRLGHPQEKMYTLKPSDFVLGRVDPTGEALKKFKGQAVFRGHLERGGRAIFGRDNVSSFDVNVKNVIHFHKFDPKGTKPEHLEYLLFGKGMELFLAHFITLPDDFDQIIAVKIPGHGLTDLQLSKGMHVIIPDRDNTAVARLKEKQMSSGQLQLPNSGAKTLSLEIIREFYFEEGELAANPTFDATEEEKKSGFPE
jgi:hypothetical protein